MEYDHKNRPALHLMSESDFIDSILSVIEAENFVKTVDFHTEKTRVLGKSIKTPCMVHKDSVFASLIIDIDKKTFKCMKAGCAASKGGNLIELYALYTGKSLNNAALALAETLNISLDDSAVDEMFENLRDQAINCLNDSNWEGLQTAYDSIQGIRAHHFELNYWKAILKENDSSTSGEELHELWKKALQDFLPLDAKRCIEILDSRLIITAPDDPELLKLKADLHERLGEKAEEQKTLIKVIRSQSSGSAPLDVELFNRLKIDYLNSEPDLYMIWGSACEGSADLDKACELYLMAEEQYHKIDDRTSALES